MQINIKLDTNWAKLHRIKQSLVRIKNLKVIPRAEEADYNSAIELIEAAQDQLTDSLGKSIAHKTSDPLHINGYSMIYHYKYKVYVLVHPLHDVEERFKKLVNAVDYALEN